METKFYWMKIKQRHLAVLKALLIKPNSSSYEISKCLDKTYNYTALLIRELIDEELIKRNEKKYSLSGYMKTRVMKNSCKKKLKSLSFFKYLFSIINV